MATVNIDSSELKKMATYVAETQPLIEKSARQEQLLAEKAEEAVEILAKQGLLSPHLKAAKAKEFASNPVSILDALQKTASVTRLKQLEALIRIPSRLRARRGQKLTQRLLLD